MTSRHHLVFVLALGPSAVAQASRPEARPAETRLATVRGRCVDAETGQPLAGVKATLGSFGRNSTDQALHAAESRKSPDPGTSDAQGRFEINFVPHGGSQYTLDLVAESHVPRTGRWSGFEAGVVDDLGDIAFARGYVVRGRVVDQEGKPVAKVGVGFHKLPLPIRSDMAANDTRYGTSGDDGAFAVSVLLPPGTWPIDVSGRGLKLVKPDAVLVRKNKGADDVTVVVRRMPAITGVVVDENGQPVPQVSLQAATRGGSGRMASGRSQKDGTFVIYAVDDEPEATAITISDPGPCEPPAADPTRHEWGTNGIKIVLTRALAREVIVVVAGTGVPVEEYAVRCHSPHANSSRQTELRLGGLHPGGKVTIDKIWRGENQLTIYPKDPSLEQLETLKIEASGPEQEPLRVELVRRRGLDVQVVDAAGAPVLRTRVELVHAAGETIDATRPIPELRNVHSFGGEYKGPRLVSFAVTDDSGSGRLFAPAKSDGLVLRVVGPGHIALLHGRVDMAAAVQPVVVRVRRGGTIAGTAGPAAIAALNLTVRLAGGQNAWDRTLSGRVTDGRFTLVDLAPGEHAIEVVASLRFEYGSGSSGTSLVLSGSRTPVKVEDGKATTVAIDLSAYAPARLEGIVTLDGRAPERARIVLVGSSADGQWRSGQFVPDEKGRFVAAGLLPGTYVPELVVGDIKVNDGSTIKLEQELELKPGDRVIKELPFRSE